MCPSENFDSPEKEQQKSCRVLHFLMFVCLIVPLLRHITVFANSLSGSQFPVLAGSDTAVKNRNITVQLFLTVDKSSSLTWLHCNGNFF
jgi:hypothetical protein